jgi:hypothetical protein
MRMKSECICRVYRNESDCLISLWYCVVTVMSEFRLLPRRIWDQLSPGKKAAYIGHSLPTSVNNYLYMLRDFPEVRVSHGNELICCRYTCYCRAPCLCCRKAKHIVLSEFATRTIMFQLRPTLLSNGNREECLEYELHVLRPERCYRRGFYSVSLMFRNLSHCICF